MSESHTSQREAGGPRAMALFCTQPVFLKVLRIYSRGAEWSWEAVYFDHVSPYLEKFNAHGDRDDS